MISMVPKLSRTGWDSNKDWLAVPVVLRKPRRSSPTASDIRSMEAEVPWKPNLETKNHHRHSRLDITV